MSALPKTKLSLIAKTVLITTIVLGAPITLLNGQALSQTLSSGNNKPSAPSGGGGGSERPIVVLPPCPPGTAASGKSPNCRPWTPPRRVASKEECKCQIKRVNGNNVRDCYVLVDNLVYYCENNQLRRK